MCCSLLTPVYTVSEDEFVDIERQFKAGSWKPETRASKFSMADYATMVESKKDATAAFRKTQKECSTRVAAEEETMFAAWLKEKEEEAASGKPVVAAGEFPGQPVASPLSASVWQVLVKVGDVIESDEQHVVELEAMKTSVFVSAGEGMAGRKVSGIAVAHADAVDPGTALVYLE